MLASLNCSQLNDSTLHVHTCWSGYQTQQYRALLQSQMMWTAGQLDILNNATKMQDGVSYYWRYHYFVHHSSGCINTNFCTYYASKSSCTVTKSCKFVRKCLVHLRMVYASPQKLARPLPRSYIQQNAELVKIIETTTEEIVLVPGN